MRESSGFPLKRRLNVLVVNPFSETISGNDEVLLRIIDKIDPDKFHFIIVQPGDSPYAERYRKMGAEVIFRRMSIIKRNLRPSFILGYTADFLPTVYRIIKLCRKHGIDIVHTNTTQILGAGLAARCLRLPSIYHAHSIIKDPMWLAKAMTLWFRLTGDYMLANSKASAGEFIRRGLPADKVSAVGNPLPVELLTNPGTRGKLRREIGVGPETPLVGIVGRVTPNKKIEQFLDASRIVAGDFPDARFVVVGGANSPSEQDYMEDMKRLTVTFELSDRVVFTGPRVDVPEIMGDLTVLAHAHTNEAFGLVVAEAMSAGVPVVAPATGGLTELVEHEITGFLVPPDSPGDLAESIIWLLRNPGRAVKMGEIGAEKVGNLFSAQRVADSIEQVYLQLAGKKL